MKTKQRQKGLIGELVAAIIFAIGVVALVQLQGVLVQNTTESNARSLAMKVNEETLETFRGFQAPGSSDEDTLGFATIDGDDADGNAGVGLVEGALTRDNTVFTRSWEVTNYYSDAAGALTTTVTGDVVQKNVVITAVWTNPDGSAGTAILDAVINKTSAAAAAAPVSIVGKGGGKPDIPYTPSTDDEVVPISVGDESKRETLIPITTSPNQGYASTIFTAYTYAAGGDHILLRQEDFKTIACECELAGNGDASGPAYPKWNTSEKTYIDEEGELVVDTLIGVVANNQQNDSCDTCCRDHHDKASLSQKYDPYRGGDFTSGDHNHYDINDNLAESDGDSYLESCRFKRVNGYWRVYQDWHMVALTVFPLADVASNSVQPIYEAYVIDIIDAHLNQPAVSGEGLISQPPKPSELNYTTSDTAVPVTEECGKKPLTARAVYLDKMYDTDDNPHLTMVQALKSVVGGADYLLHVPFYEVSVKNLSDWESDGPTIVSVGLENALLQPGVVLGHTELSHTDVSALIKKSNSGIVALNHPVDSSAATNPDEQTLTDLVMVTVGAAGTLTCSTVTSTTITVANCSTSVSGRTVNDADTVTIAVDGGQTGTCTKINKNYTCPTQNTILEATISVTSTVGGEMELTSICGNQRVVFTSTP